MAKKGITGLGVTPNQYRDLFNTLGFVCNNQKKSLSLEEIRQIFLRDYGKAEQEIKEKGYLSRKMKYNLDNTMDYLLENLPVTQENMSIRMHLYYAHTFITQQDNQQL